jgi:hypothetical protein
VAQPFGKRAIIRDAFGAGAGQINVRVATPAAIPMTEKSVTKRRTAGL